MLHDGMQQRLQVGLGAEPAAELDQGLAVIVAMAVKGAIDPGLEPALERLEGGRCANEGNGKAPLAGPFRQAVMDPEGNENDGAEVAAENHARGQRVSHAALEDQVRVHQAVAHNGPGERERQKHQRQASEIGQQVRRIELQQVRNRVKEREWQHREQRSPRDPFQLLAQQRRGGAAVAAQEQQCRQDVEQGEVAGGDLVQAVEQEFGRFTGTHRPDPQCQQPGAGRVNQRQ